MQTDWIDELRRLLTESTFTDAETLAAHSGDKWHATSLPQAVLKARCTEEVSAAMRLASRYGVPVTPRSAGVGYVGGLRTESGWLGYQNHGHESHSRGESGRRRRGGAAGGADGRFAVSGGGCGLVLPAGSSLAQREQHRRQYRNECGRTSLP